MEVITHDLISDKLIQQIIDRGGVDMNSNPLWTDTKYQRWKESIHKHELSIHLKDDTYKSLYMVEFI